MEGWHGWDAYAPFYDWENARTVGRRDIPFWRRQVVACGGPVLELGCGTGRVLLPMARTGEPVVGLDRSTNMLGLARRRLRRARGTDSARLVRGERNVIVMGDMNCTAGELRANPRLRTTGMQVVTGDLLTYPKKILFSM